MHYFFLKLSNIPLCIYKWYRFLKMRDHRGKNTWGCVGVNSVKLVLSIPNFPAQWPCTLLGTGRIEEIGDLAGWLIPTEWIRSQKSHFQEPFFSKVICEHRRKRLHREQWLNFHTVSPLTSVVFGLGISESNTAWTHGIVLPTLSWNCVTIILILSDREFHFWGSL